MAQTDSADGFVDVYASETGRPMRVPEHWLDHPVLSKGIRKTPPKGKAAAESPSTDTARNRGAAQTPASRGEES